MDDIWKEIAALQNQLAQTQKADFGPRLSERNCVDIVQKLLRMKLVDLVFSSDGREYITPARLQRDILTEVELHGGRIDIEQLAEQLNVDVDVVKRSGEQLTKQHENVRFVLHELISDTYLRRAAEQISEQLDVHGIITSAHVCKQFNLPSHIPELIFLKFLGVIIHAQRATSDKAKLFTTNAVSRHRCIWRGMLSACTRPSSLQTLLQNNNPDLDRGLSFQVIEELISSGSARGALSSSRFETALYTPAVLADARRSYVTKSLLRDSGSIEYERVKRQLDVADAKSFIRKAVESELGSPASAESSVVFFQSCAANISLVNHIESYIQEAIAADGYADLTQSGLCPSSFSAEDYRELVKRCKGSDKQKDWCSLSNDQLLVSQQLITNYVKFAAPLVDEEAQNVANELIKVQEVRKALLALGNNEQAESDSATQTVEAKNKKAGKKIGKSSKSADAEDATPVVVKGQKALLSFVPESKFTDSKLETVFSTNASSTESTSLKQLPREVAKPLIKTYIGPQVRQQFQSKALEHLRAAAAAAALQQQQNNADGSVGGIAGGDRQITARSVTALRDQALNTMQRLKAFEKSTELFTSNADTRDQLRKHLAKNVGAELLATLLMYCEAAELIKMSIRKTATAGAGDAGASVQYDKHEDRRKAIDQLPLASGMRQSFIDLNDAVNKGNMDVFNEKLDECLQYQDLGLVVRKKDRKSDRALLVEYTHELKQQLEKTLPDDLTAVLHLVVLILFSTLSKHCLHASGKFVPAIIKEYLTDKIAVVAATGEEGGEDVTFLRACLQHVIDQVKGTAVMSEDEKRATVEKCKALVTKYEKKSEV